jgi:hypothetical protein
MMKEQPREPMPDSNRPLWVFLGFMLLIVVVMAVASAIIDLLVS